MAISVVKRIYCTLVNISSHSLRSVNSQIVCGAMRNITANCIEGLAACFKAGSEKAVTAVLEMTKDDRVRESACRAIINMCYNGCGPFSDEGAAACVRAGALAAIVSILKPATKDDEVMLCGSMALAHMAQRDGKSRPAF